MTNPKYVSVEHQIPDFARWANGLDIAPLLAACGLNESNANIHKIRMENPGFGARYGYLLVCQPDEKGIQTYVIADLRYAAGRLVRRPKFYVEVQNAKQPMWKKLMTYLAPRVFSSNPEADLTERVAEGFTNDSLPELRHGFVTSPSLHRGWAEVHHGPIEELNQRVNEILGLMHKKGLNKEKEN